MEKRKLLIFVAICFSLSYLAAGLFYLLGGEYASIAGVLFSSTYMIFPVISVILTQLITKEKVLSNCGISFKLNIWWLIALLVMPMLCTLMIPISALLPGFTISTENELMSKTMEYFAARGLNSGPWGILAVTFISSLFAGATINALFALGEEAAWRGYLDHCLKGLGFWKESALVGAIWGAWHAPIILMGHNYPSHTVAGVFMMILFCISMAPIMLFFKRKSNSVIGAAITHGSMNAMAGASLLYLNEYNDLLCGPTGLMGIIVFLVVDLLIFLTAKKTTCVMVE